MSAKKVKNVCTRGFGGYFAADAFYARQPPPVGSPQSCEGGDVRRITWVVEQHDQIKGRVSILRSKVDVGALAQQVLDNVFIAGSRKQRNKHNNRRDWRSGRRSFRSPVDSRLDLFYP